MIKVLQIFGSLGRGGLETFVMNVYRAIDKANIQFDFLLRSSGGDYEEEAKSLGASIYYTGERNNGLLTYYKKLDRFFFTHKGEYNAVHVHVSTLSNIEVLYYAKKYGVDIRILHSHSSSVSGSKLHYITHNISKLFVKSLATHYIGCSEKANIWLYKNTGAFKDSVMLPNGIKVQDYVYDKNKRRQIRKALSIKEDALVLGHVGRFIWVKNHKFLVDIFACVHAFNKNAYLILVGNGVLFDEIHDYVESKGLSDYVQFLGLRNDIPDILQSFDIFIMPSIYEGLPVVLVEAQASGLPVLCSDTISEESKLTNNYYRLSLKEGCQSWANKCISILNNYVRANTRNEIVAHGFDIEETSKILTEIYTGRK